MNLATIPEALVTFLSAQSFISTLVGTRVFGLELPATESKSMPRNAVVLKMSGGPGGLGSSDDRPITRIRFDVLNYGATPLDALSVQRATHCALKSINRNIESGTLLHSAEQSAGPVNLRDPQGNWPLVLETFFVLAAEITVT